MLPLRHQLLCWLCCLASKVLGQAREGSVIVRREGVTALVVLWDVFALVLELS